MVRVVGKEGASGAGDIYIYIYMIMFLREDSVRSFFSSRLQYAILGPIICFVRAPSSGGGSNAPRLVASVPHLPGRDRVRRLSETKTRIAQIVVTWAVYARAILGSCHIQSLNEKIVRENIYSQVGIISKLVSYFVPTTRFSWSHLEVFGLLCTSYD